MRTVREVLEEYLGKDTNEEWSITNKILKEISDMIPKKKKWHTPHCFKTYVQGVNNTIDQTKKNMGL